MPDTYYFGRRPTGFYIPRYRNLDGQDSDFLRGYGFQGGVSRTGGAGAVQGRGGLMGEELKAAARDLGPWRLAFAGFGEVLPNPENRITLNATQKDQWGLPVPHIACRLGENELKLAAAIQADGRAMAEAAGGRVVASLGTPSPLGLGIHEMGTACMGTDPNKSVLNKWNQAHDIPNLFITDGAAMASSGCQNPSLTYMALSARAADHAVQLLQEGAL
jgi:choline dehydrogenase-like flavoprotein